MKEHNDAGSAAMRPFLLLGMLSSLLALTGCATGNPPRVVKEEPPRLMLVGVDQIPKDIQATPTYVVFDNSTSMTNYLREALAKRGFQITSQPEEARYVIRISGEFHSKGRINVKPTELGPIFDNADAAMRKRDYSVTPDVGDTLNSVTANAYASQMLNAGYLHGVGVGIVGALLEATGLAGRFNEMVAGDPKGFCIKDCEDRAFSRQHARVEAFLTLENVQIARFGRAAEAYQPAFVPQALILMALDGTVNAILEGTQR